MSSPVSKRSGEKSSGGSGSSKDGKTSNGQSTSEPQPQTLNIYVAILEPLLGDYYEWAFALNNQETQQWHLFQVIQDRLYGPFRTQYSQIDPRTLQRCIQPLMPLGEMDQGWLWTLTSDIAQIRVTNLAVEWNSQDYVIIIWDIVGRHSMVAEEIYRTNRQCLFGIYRQNLGGAEEQFLSAEEELDELRIRFEAEEFTYDWDEYQ